MNKPILTLRPKDFKVSFIRGSGPGGQHRNKTSTGCRIEHPASGAMATATDNKSQKMNKRAAFQRLIKTERFQKWFRFEVARAMGRVEEVEQEVERAMRPANIKTEVQDNGKWIEWADNNVE